MFRIEGEVLMLDIKVFFEWAFAAMLLVVSFVIMAVIAILACVAIVRVALFLFRVASGNTARPLGETREVGDICTRCGEAILAADPIALRVGQSSPQIYYVVCHKCRARFLRGNQVEERRDSA